jgi:putative oxidoreductase
MATLTNNAPAPAAKSLRPAASTALVLDDFGKLLLRLALGGLLLLHGLAKIHGGIDFVIDGVAKMGLPPVVAYGVYIGEVLAPLLLILGIWTRSAALVVVINMLAAVALVHVGDLRSLSPSGGWKVELQAFYLATALAIALLGPGRCALGAVDQRPLR